MVNLALKLLRVGAIGFCFVLIFFGGLVVSLLTFPLIAAGGRVRHRARRLTLRAVGTTFSFVIKVNCAVGVLRDVRVSGQENIPDEPALFIANHPSYLDILVILSEIPYSNCIVKGFLLRSPFLGLMMRSAGYISNTDGAALLRAAEESFKSGRSLVIFPEGTRTKGKEMNAFQRGAARIFLRSSPPVVPVLIKTEPALGRKDTPWYQLPDESVEFSVHFGSPLKIPDSVLRDAREQIRARELTAFFREEIEQQLRGG